MKKCICGSNVFIKVTEVRGQWVTLLTVDDHGGIKTEGCGDEVRTEREPKTVRCDTCKRRYANPHFEP